MTHEINEFGNYVTCYGAVGTIDLLCCTIDHLVVSTTINHACKKWM